MTFRTSQAYLTLSTHSCVYWHERWHVKLCHTMLQSDLDIRHATRNEIISFIKTWSSCWGSFTWFIMFDL